MTTTIHRMAARLAGAAAVALAAAVGRADDFAPEAGFVSLFNGKDLAGFKYKGAALDGKAETADKRFTVADGAVVIADVGKADPKLLDGARDFNKSFVLRLEYRAEAKASAGLSVRGQTLKLRDFIRRNENKQLASVFKNDGWNEVEIVVTNGVLVSKVNGKTLAATDAFELSFKDGRPVGKLNGQDVEVTSADVSKAAVAVCKLNGVAFEPGFRPGAKGGLGLQAESGKVEFRRIRIKEGE